MRAAAMNVFVFPSLWEGLPLVMIEAQAAGLRCIVSDVVTNEVTILPEHSRWLPLSAGAETWAAETVHALERERIVRDSALQAVAQTDFCTQKSALSELYLTAME